MSLLELAGDHAKIILPIINSDGVAFCGYSPQENMPECPLHHRGHIVETEINGVRKRLYRCWDSRMHDYALMKNNNSNK